MRHRRYGRKLNRNLSQRKALFKNLIAELILHQRIKTTEAKAKAVRRLVDKLVTRAKKGTVQARRLIAAFLPNRKAANKLVDEIVPKLERKSGFTSFERIERRRGDNATVVELKWAGAIEAETVGPEAEQPKKSRKKRGGTASVKLQPKAVKELGQKPVGKALPVRSDQQAATQKRGER